MRIAAIYLTVVLLWSTTPLAIKWSAEEAGFIFGAASRMIIGAICMFFVLILMRKKLPWHSKARQTYLAVALQIYGAMLAVYWSSQFIPSGWISIIFGLTPFITALFTHFWLGQKSLSLDKLLAYALGISGLVVMFNSALQLGLNAMIGIAGVLLASTLQSLSSVWVKRINAKLPATKQVTGGLFFAVPAYIATWLIMDGEWPASLSITTISSIVYLGVIATTIGFAFYYYLLTHMAATHVALITLIAPVLALLLGHSVNHEPITAKVVTGTALILSALLLHTFFDRFKSVAIYSKKHRL